VKNSKLARCAPMLLLPVVALLLAACDPREKPTESFAEAADDSPLEHAAKHLDRKYVCPMHPQIVRDQPDSCPLCGMDLVVRMVDPGQGKRPEVQVDSAIAQSMGIRTAPVERDTLWKYIRTVGRVSYDETRLAHVHPRAEGWIEKLALRAEGDPVERGQLLGEIYSPDILSAQVDFLIALDQGSDRSASRVEKARNRLRLLGVPEGTISRIQQRRKTQNLTPLLAPTGGVVTQLGAREGMYVKPETEVFTLADLSRIWVLVDVFEHQIDWLAVGRPAEISVPAYPGRSWEGSVEYIYPELDPIARTLRVRLAFDNPEGLLKHNMFADVIIYGGPKRGVAVIPREALIETGERISVVKVNAEERFQPVDVVVGMRAGDRVEILSGIEVGDRVVTSGQFLIDSESSLQASFSRLGGE